MAGHGTDAARGPPQLPTKVLRGVTEALWKVGDKCDWIPPVVDGH